LRVCEQYQLAYFVIAKSDFEQFHLKQGDTEGLVNYALSIKGIVIAAIIIERGEEIKLSFRSVGDYAVNTFAERYFQGGGHKNAAGGNSEESLEKTEEIFMKLIKQNVLNTKI
ncbi:MAG: DHHA1 domain-containing protein, partial [Ekhidna sp.]|nr:DHHA1 domain-containing protein [Ekhidna sp.]